MRARYVRAKGHNTIGGGIMETEELWAKVKQEYGDAFSNLELRPMPCGNTFLKATFEPSKTQETVGKEEFSIFFGNLGWEFRGMMVRNNKMEYVFLKV